MRIAEEPFDLAEISRLGRGCVGIVVSLQPRRVCRPLDVHGSRAANDRQAGERTWSYELGVVVEESGREDHRPDPVDPSRCEAQLEVAGAVPARVPDHAPIGIDRDLDGKLTSVKRPGSELTTDSPVSGVLGRAPSSIGN